MAKKGSGFSGDDELTADEAAEHAEAVAQDLVKAPEFKEGSLPPGPVDVEKVGSVGLADFVAGIADDGNPIFGVNMPVASDDDQPQEPAKFVFAKGWRCPDPPQSIDRVAEGATISKEEINRFLEPELWKRVNQLAVGSNANVLNHVATRMYVAFEAGGFDCLGADPKEYPRVEKNEAEGSFQTLFMQRLLGRDLHARLRNAAVMQNVSTIAALNYGLLSMLNKGLL